MRFGFVPVMAFNGNAFSIKIVNMDTLIIP